MKSLPYPGSAGLGSSALTPPARQGLQISTDSKGQARPDGQGCWARVPQDRGLAQRLAYLHPGAPAELEMDARVKAGTEHSRFGSELGSGRRACADSLGVQGLSLIRLISKREEFSPLHVVKLNAGL